jgi:hypothetical protein
MSNGNELDDEIPAGGVPLKSTTAKVNVAPTSSAAGEIDDEIPAGGVPLKKAEPSPAIQQATPVEVTAENGGGYGATFSVNGQPAPSAQQSVQSNFQQVWEGTPATPTTETEVSSLFNEAFGAGVEQQGAEQSPFDVRSMASNIKPADYYLDDQQKKMLSELNKLLPQQQATEEVYDPLNPDVSTGADQTASQGINQSEFFRQNKSTYDNFYNFALTTAVEKKKAEAQGKTVDQYMSSQKREMARSLATNQDVDPNTGVSFFGGDGINQDYMNLVSKEYFLKSEMERLKSVPGYSDDNYFGQKYREYEKQYNEFRNKRYQNVDAAVSQMEKMLERNLTPSQRDFYENKLDEYKAMRGDFFSAIPTIDEVKNTVSDSSIKLLDALPSGLSEKEKFELWYKTMYDEYITLSQSYGGAMDTPKDFLSQIPIAGDALKDDDRDRYYRLKRDLQVMAPLFFLNSSISGFGNEPGFAASATESALSMISPNVEGTKSTKYSDRNALVVSMLNDIGVKNENINQAQLGANVEQSTPDPLMQSDFKWYNPASWVTDFDADRLGELAGTTGGIMIPLLMTRNVPALGSLQKGLSAIDKAGKATSLEAAYVSSFVNSNSKIAKAIGKALDEAYSFEMAGNIFTNNEDQLNFAAGFAGSILGQAVEPFIGKALSVAATEKGAMYTKKLLTDRGVKAIASSVDKTGAVVSRGIGETGQELGEELTNIYLETENGQSFIDAVKEKFPDMESWQEFLVGSFVMGAAFGYNSSMDVFKSKYKTLTEEQKKKVDPIVAEVIGNVVNSVANAVSKTASKPEVQAELAKEEQVQQPVQEEIKPETVKAPSPNREAFEQSVNVAFEGKADTDQISAALSLAEARAKVWSKQTGKDIDEWYADKSAQESSPEDLVDQPVLYQFVGEGSNLTPKQKTDLSSAKKLQESGSDATNVWQKTGWYYDRADDKWKTEVPGQDNVVFKPSSNDNGDVVPGTKKLSEVLEWNELYESHPFLKDIEIEIQDSKNSELAEAKALGYADLSNNKIAVRAGSIADMYLTLRHEVQHFIQKQEGFQPGSAPEDFVAAGYSKPTAKKIYTKSSGEVEARNVSERSLLSDEEREMISPEETMIETIDMNPGDRIVLDSKAENGGWTMSINTVNRKMQGKPAENRTVDLTKKLSQGEKGAIEFGDNSAYIIHAFESADISTLIHELFHGFRRDIYDARDNASTPELKSQIDEDIKTLEQWAGVKDGVWDVKAEEKVARAGERYMRDGKAPSPELKSVFDRMKDWFTEIYSALKGSPINVKIDEDVREVFDRMFAEKQAKEESTSIKDKFKKVADATRKLKMPEQFMKDMAGAAGANKLLLKAWDGMIELAAKTIETSGSVAQAVANAIGFFQTTEYFQSLPEQAREKAVNDMKNFIKSELEKVADPEFSNIEDEGTRTAKRKTAERLLSNEKELTEQAAEAVKEVETYYQRSRSINEQEAKNIIDKFGVDVATTIAMNKRNGLDAAVRITLASMIVKSSEEMAKDFESKGEQVSADRVRERSVEITNFMMKFATELGRGVDALKILNEFSPKQFLALMNVQNNKIRSNIEKNREKINEFISLYEKSMDNVIKSLPKTIDEAVQNQVDKPSKQSPEKSKEELSNTLNSILKDGVTDKLVETIAKDYGLSKDVASKIAKDVVDKVTTQKNDASKVVSDNAPVVNRKLKKAIDDILGDGSLMTRDEIENIIKKEYGIKDPDKDFVSYIESLQEKLKNLKTDAAKRKVAIEIMKSMYNYSVYGSKDAKNKIPVPPSDLMWSMWYANTLSSIDTQKLNFNANLIKSLVEMPINSILALTPRLKSEASNIPGIKVGKSKVLTYPDMKRAVSIWKAFATGVGTKGVSEAASTIAYGPSSTIRSDLTGIENVVNPLEDVRYKGGSINPLNYLKYVGRFMAATDEIFFSGAEAVKLYEIVHMEGRNKGLSGKALNDFVNEKMGYTKKEWSETIAEATKDVESDMKYMGENYSPTKKRAMTYRRAWEIWENKVDAHYIERAKNYGRKFTYNYKPQGALGVVAELINNGVKKMPALRLVVPFTKVVANVFNEMLGYTPFGIPGVIRENEREEQARSALKVVVGSTLLTAVALAYDDDDDSGFKIYGKGPTDWDKQAQLRETGWLPYSIKIGDKYYSYQFSPLFAVLSFAGNTADHRRWNDQNESDILTESAFVLQRSVSGMLEQSYLTGINGFLSGLVDSKGDMNAFEKTVGNLTRPLSGFIPWKGLLSNIDRMTDSNVYRRDDLLSMIAANIPFVRRASGEKLNALGEPIKYGDRFSQEIKEHPVYTPLIKRGLFIPDYNKGQELPDGTKITDDQYWDIIKQSGTEAKQFLLDTGLDKIATMSDTQAQEYLNKIFSRFRRKALMQLWMGKNSVIDQGNEFNDAIMVRESDPEPPQVTKLY